MHWECRECSYFGFTANNRIYSGSLLEWAYYNNKDWARRTQQAASLFRSGQGSLNDLYKTWAAVRKAYVRTSVTYQNDKLVALSGLAAAFQRLLLDTYLAGIWQKTACYDLLWHVFTPGKRSKNGSPSWSWASREDADIYWSVELPRHPHDSHELATVVWAETQSNNALNPHGRVDSGLIQLQCFFLPFDLGAHKFSEAFLHDIHDRYGDDRGPTELPPLVILLDRGLEEFFNEETQRQFYCLPLVLSSDAVVSGRFLLEGLVAGCKGDKNYERVGYFRCTWGNVKDLYWYLDFVGLVSAVGDSKGHFYGSVNLV
ncbi:hypothetical protein ACJ41O_009234 [Fusarium nematophilum]